MDNEKRVQIKNEDKHFNIYIDSVFMRSYVNFHIAQATGEEFVKWLNKSMTISDIKLELALNDAEKYGPVRGDRYEN